MPAGVTTLGTIRATCQQRCDMVNSGFIATAEWNGLINTALQELYGLLVQKYGNMYYAATAQTFVTDGTNYLFALPTTDPNAFFKLYGVELQFVASDPNSWITLRPFPFLERNRWALPNYQTLWGITNLHYALYGTNLWLSPLPQAGQTIRLQFAPRFVALVNDSDTFDGVNGWEEYAVADVCIKALTKEESDPTVYIGIKEALTKRLEAEAENRDPGSPARVVDTQWSNADWMGWTGDGSAGGGGV